MTAPPPAGVSIRAAACHFPEATASLADVLAAEGLEPSAEGAERLGIDSVHACEPGAGGTPLALAAAREALELAGVKPAKVDVIVDYSILPQEYLVPAWSMGNRLQAELGAKRAFTLGFSGGGASNLQVALSSAAALLRADEGIDIALLVGAEVAIPGNRVLSPERPVTVLGDGASALVLARGGDGTDGNDGKWGDELLDTRLASDGAAHDVCYVPGGAMEHPDREDLYRLTLDAERYPAEAADDRLTALCDSLLEAAGLGRGDVAALVYPNLSTAGRERFAGRFGAATAGDSNLARHGHVQGTDLVLNYLSAREATPAGGHLLFASDGWGFLYGATLVQLRSPGGEGGEA